MSNQDLTISDEGIDAIKEFEGFRARPYTDTAGFQTVGYGHKVVAGDGVCGIITPVQGTSLLRQDIRTAEEAVCRNVTVDLTQWEFDALVSFVYNLGEQRLKTSTLLKKLNADDALGAGEEFLKWCYAGGVKSDGILHRREQERDMFENNVYPAPALSNI